MLKFDKGRLRSPALVAILAVFLAGTAINVENSGNPVDSAKEAVDRIFDDVTDGYKNGQPITQEVYNARYNQ